MRNVWEPILLISTITEKNPELNNLQILLQYTFCISEDDFMNGWKQNTKHCSFTMYVLKNWLGP